MSGFFQKAKERNIPLYYLLTISTNLWFSASCWLYVWRRFMSYGQLGWVDALGFGFSLILDIPTGAFADIFGKRITLILSSVCTATGIMVIALGNSLMAIFFGNMIAQLGWSLYSGAADAMAYDTLLDLKRGHEFTKILAKANVYMSYAAAFGYFLSGPLYHIQWRLPSIVWSLSYVPAILFSWMVMEPESIPEHFSVQGYFRKIRLGIQELWLPQLRKYLLLLFVLLGIYFLYTWGFVRPAIATSFGFYANEQAIILPILTLLCAYFLQFLPLIRKRVSNFIGLTLLSFIMALGFFMSGFPIGYWGVIPMFLVTVAGKFAGPWVSVVVNDEISSKYRATTLSTVSLITKIPYVFVAVAVGAAFEGGHLAQFCFIMAGIIMGITGISGILLLISRRSNHLKVA